MTITIPNGETAAFSIQASDAQGSFYAEIGLTKREYMATAILAGLMADPRGPRSSGPKFAVEMADVLLAELAKVGTT
jgi:hypothetical protein